MSDSQRVAGAIGVAIDISIRVETQRENEALAERLAQTQRLESVGQLAGGIAHDFNNLLAVILTYASFAQHQLDAGSPLADPIRAIRAAADRAGELTSGLLQFSRHQPFAATLIDLNHCTVAITRLLGRTLGEPIRVRTELEPAVWPFVGDRRQLEQVMINLAVNARDAMPDGGELTFATSNRTLGWRSVRRLGDLSPGQYVCLRVADTGVGMTDEVRARLFEPFFTTKEPGRGTGLGLASVYGMVAKSGGHIFVSSEPGKGAVFEIYWPRASASEGLKPLRKLGPDALEAVPPSGTGEIILIAEDEDGVRKGTAEILSAHGYQVIAVADGERAMAEVARRSRIDLLLTDVVMPGMSGAELAARVEETHPGVRVLFMSGCGYEATRPDVVRAAKLLRKPFAAEALLARVAEELRSDPAQTPGG